MHEREKTLAHDHEHNHDHGRNHDHDHNHNHEHASGEAPSREETLALLSYMVHHNKHHAEELSELSKSLDGEASISLQKAISAFENGNAELERALELMQKESC